MYQILTWSATCCMWRVEKISKWEDKKKFIALPCAKKKHTANHDFAVCHKKAHGKVFLCRVLWFCRVFSWAHSAKIIFAVCPWICTRQTMVHTAKSKFLVMHIGKWQCRRCYPCVKNLRISCLGWWNNLSIHVYNMYGTVPRPEICMVLLCQGCVWLM